MKKKSIVAVLAVLVVLFILVFSYGDVDAQTKGFIVNHSSPVKEKEIVGSNFIGGGDLIDQVVGYTENSNVVKGRIKMISVDQDGQFFFLVLKSDGKFIRTYPNYCKLLR